MSHGSRALSGFQASSFRLVRSVVVFGLFALFASSGARAADFHLFGRMGSSSSLGVDGPSLGLESRVQAGDWILCVMAVDAQKATGESALFWGGNIEYRRQTGRFLYGGRINVVAQETANYSKSASYLSARFGYELKDNLNLLMTYNAPDNTENEAWGVGLTVEALARPFSIIGDVERVWYRGGAGAPYQQGTRLALLLGWRF